MTGKSTVVLLMGLAGLVVIGVSMAVTQSTVPVDVAADSAPGGVASAPEAVMASVPNVAAVATPAIAVAPAVESSVAAPIAAPAETFAVQAAGPAIATPVAPAPPAPPRLVQAPGGGAAIPNPEIPGGGISDTIPIAQSDQPRGTDSTQDAAGMQRISVRLDDVPLEDVVRLFTRLTDANIIATTTNLQGTVTVNLQDVEWQTGLRAILDTKGLELRENPPVDSGVFTIQQKVAGALPPLQTVILQLKYATVTDVQKALQPILSAHQPPGSVHTFPARNMLIVRVIEENIPELDRVIMRLDQPREQVSIEAKFVELDDSSQDRLGINWQSLAGYGVALTPSAQWGRSRDWTFSRNDTQTLSDNRSNNDQTAANYDANGQLVTGSRDTADTIARGRDVQSVVQDSFQRGVSDSVGAVLQADTFRVVLSALKTLSGATVVSNPKVLVANEEEAEIHIGQVRRPLVPETTTAEATVVAIYRPVPKEEAIEDGVKLKVTPTISTVSNITVRIEPKISTLLPRAQWDTAPDGSFYPVVLTKTINTIFSLGSGAVCCR